MNTLMYLVGTHPLEFSHLRSLVASQGVYKSLTFFLESSLQLDTVPVMTSCQ